MMSIVDLPACLVGAFQVIPQYVIEQNRPYSALDVYNNLHQEYGKTLVAKALEHGVSQDVLKEKIISKQKIYYANQDRLISAADDEALASLEADIARYGETYATLSSKYKLVQHELTVIQASGTTEQLRLTLEDGKKTCDELRLRLASLKDARNDAAEAEALQIISEKGRVEKVLNQRKRLAKDMLDVIGEESSLPKKKLMNRMFSSDQSRELSEQEKEKLAKQDLAPEHKRWKLERDAQANWDRFYKRNRNNFFKDRNWSAIDLQEACSSTDLTKPFTYLEAGCGVGNMLFPIAEAYPYWNYRAFDFSANAVTLLKERARESSVSVDCAQFDLTASYMEKPLFDEQADIATLIYVISGIEPEKHFSVASNMFLLIKKGGVLIVRDYAINDHAMVRFGRAARLADRFYARQDGTRAFFFTIDDLCSPFERAGFVRIKCDYLHRRTINHEKGIDVPRVFVQAILSKPPAIINES